MTSPKPETWIEIHPHPREEWILAMTLSHVRITHHWSNGKPYRRFWRKVVAR